MLAEFERWVAREGMVDDVAELDAALKDEKTRAQVLARIRAETLNATLGNDARYRALAEEDHQIQEALRQFPRAAEILALRKGERVDPRVAEREAAEVQSEPLQR